METTTNRNWRQFISGWDVPAKVLNDYDYLSDDESSHGWIHYRRTWYHISDFLRTNQPGWDGAHGDSFFSAVAIKLSEDGEEYQIGTLIS